MKVFHWSNTGPLDHFRNSQEVSWRQLFHFSSSWEVIGGFCRNSSLLFLFFFCILSFSIFLSFSFFFLLFYLFSSPFFSSSLFSGPPSMPSWAPPGPRAPKLSLGCFTLTMCLTLAFDSKIGVDGRPREWKGASSNVKAFEKDYD